MAIENEEHRSKEDQSRDLTDNISRNVEKNPDHWATGEEPMTGPQRSYLNTLAREAGERDL